MGDTIGRLTVWLEITCANSLKKAHSVYAQPRWNGHGGVSSDAASFPRSQYLGSGGANCISHFFVQSIAVALGRAKADASVVVEKAELAQKNVCRPPSGAIGERQRRLDLMLGALCSTRVTSSMLSTTGSLRATGTGLIFFIASGGNRT